jgi:deoxyribodipyrimidine photo-lyase
VESLVDLDNQICEISKNKVGLYIYYGDELKILQDIIKHIPDIKTISFNLDYTKYSQERDKKIEKLCMENGLKCLSLDDICLNPIGSVLTTTGKVYSKYTPFLKASENKTIKKTTPFPATTNTHTKCKFPNNSIKNMEIIKSINKLNTLSSYISLDDVISPNGKILQNVANNQKIAVHGGRANALVILKKISEWREYDNNRDELTYKTTLLSAYNKFGCISIREVYWTIVAKLGKSSGLIKQLFWRDFFYHLSSKYPEIYQHSLNPKYRDIKWVNNTGWFKLWCEGKTGFPVVDACMRQLNTTGYMHNRGRLIVSSFLCRMMHIDWRWGEKYFASKLVDYDPAQNNFGWQVSGANSSGTTSRPLEQTILNPWLQSSQFDKNGEYIKFWCPELNAVNSNDLHKWNLTCEKWLANGTKYIKPILDYKTEKENNLKMYKKYI